MRMIISEDDFSCFMIQAYGIQDDDKILYTQLLKAPWTKDVRLSNHMTDRKLHA